MKLKLKSKIFIRKILLIDSVILFLILILFSISNNLTFNSLDWKLLDIFYKNFIMGKRVPISKQIKYVPITASTYYYFHSNLLDRGFLAELNNTFVDLSPDAIVYDIIFAYPSNAEKDKTFAESIKNEGNIFLPVAFKTAENNIKKAKFNWNNKTIKRLIEKDYSKPPEEIGEGNPPKAVWAFTQQDQFMVGLEGTGHINSFADNDGIFRHIPLLIRVDSLLFPTISLSVFLKYNEIAFSSLKIYWGDKIIIPAGENNYLEKNIEIPIDNRGFFYVPFPQVWGKCFKMIEAQNLLQKYKSGNSYNELVDFFEGNFVFISDTSPGVSDLGNTPIEKSVPLVKIHASTLNALLTNTFFRRQPKSNTILLIIIIGLIIILSSLLKNNSWFYLASVFVFLLLLGDSYYSIIHFIFLPIASISIALSILFLTSLIIVQVMGIQHQNFVKTTFAHYIPAKLVDIVIENPELLKLGGDEKKITILFSDIAGFTSISETMHPEKLVKFLNQYLTEMTEIILNNEGIVDKFLGDGIMAEFGAPVGIPHNANLAVNCALQMQKKLEHLNKIWISEGLPQISIRIGLNTGNVIVGNMGSNNVFDYTAIGDNVNIASRLEGANKYYGTKILISESAYLNINKNDYLTRPIDFIRVKGRTGLVKVFEVIDYKTNEIADEEKEFLKLFNKGFEFFASENFNESIKYFYQAEKLRSDMPTKILIDRINNILKNNAEKGPIDIGRTLTIK